jgi:hypothetical protein
MFIKFTMNGQRYEESETTIITENKQDAFGFVMLTTNAKRNSVIEVVKNLDAQYNQYHNYTWYFFNNEPFQEVFQAAVMTATRGKKRQNISPCKTLRFSEIWNGVR